MSRSSTNGAPALQAYFLETSAAAAAHRATSPGAPPTEAPWAGRRLRHALADLGPARPATFDISDTGVQMDAEAGDRAETPRPLPRPTRPPHAASVDVDTGGWHDQETANPLPPTIASLIAALPVQAPALRPDEIVAALAGTGPDPVAAGAIGRDLPVPMLPEAHERPPMIIERAHAERELRAGAPVAETARPNPLLAMATGFAFALATGAALYVVLVLR